MKYLLIPILSCSLISCQTPDQNAKLAAISSIAISYAEAKGAITPQDAALVREAGKVLLEPTPSIPEVVVTATK